MVSAVRFILCGASRPRAADQAITKSVQLVTSGYLKTALLLVLDGISWAM